MSADKKEIVEKNLRVNIEETWLNTGLVVYPESFVTISYKSGFCRLNGGFRRFDGEGNYWKKAPFGYLLIGEPPGALIGKVGEFLFHIGSGKVIQHQSGPLYLAINHLMTDFSDETQLSNNGYFNVRITVVPFDAV